MSREVVLAYPGFEALAASLARAGGELGEVHLRAFPDGELSVRVGSDVEGARVTIACGLQRPDRVFLGLAMLAETARDLGAKSVLLVAPYLSYMRQDERFRPGEGVTSRYFARLLSELFDGMVTMDPHLHRCPDLGAIFGIPTVRASSAAAVAAWVDAHAPGARIVGPDEESAQWADAIAAHAATARPAIVLTKERRGDRDVEVSAGGLSELDGRPVVVVDDIVSTGRTMVAAIERVQAAGARVAACVGVHAVFSDDGALELMLGTGAGQVVTCNTITHPTNAVDVTDALVEAWEELRGVG